MRIAENKQNQWLDISRRVRRRPCRRRRRREANWLCPNCGCPEAGSFDDGSFDGAIARSRRWWARGKRAPCAPDLPCTSHTVSRLTIGEARSRPCPAHEAASDRSGCRMRPRPSSSLWLKLNDCSCSRYLRTLRISRSMLLNCERRPHKAAVVSAMAGSVFNPECMHV
jgi:hypothetical protein